MLFRKYPWILFLFCLLLPLIVGGISGIATVKSLDSWYAGLNKPFFNPPNSVFGPVWTLLYTLMGISLYLVLRRTQIHLRNRALRVFLFQLGLNFLWSFLFFYFENPLLALFDIVMLWLCILWMIRLFFREDHWAGLLNIPYLLWVTFATSLNAAIYMLNG